MKPAIIGAAIITIAAISGSIMHTLFTTSSVNLDMDKYPVKYNVFVINDGNMKTYNVYNAQKITDNTVEITMPSGSRYTISGDYIEISRLE